MKLNKLLLAGSLSALVFFTACEKEEDVEKEEVTQQDKNFALQASMSNRAEIELGNLALTQATNDSVKYFAQLMVTEHTQAQNELKAVADSAKLGVDLEQSLGAEFTAVQQALSALSGAAFDSVYMRSQVEAHQVSVTNFQNQVNTGGSQEVKSYANDQLPGLQTHLEMATRIRTQVQ